MSVYFIKVGRYIKVGFSENPQRRTLKLWQSGTRYTRPYDLSLNEVPELLLAIEGDKSDESRCHEALSDYRVGLEWFVDEPGVREFMTHAERGEFPVMTRPEGEFIPVSFDEAIPEWHAEVDRMLARARAKAAS